MTVSKWGNIPAAVFLSAAGTPTGAQNSSAIETILLPFSADDIAAGSLQYKRTCAQCHGRTKVNSGTTRHDLRCIPVDLLDRFFSVGDKGEKQHAVVRNRLDSRANQSASGLRGQPRWQVPLRC